MYKRQYLHHEDGGDAPVESANAFAALVAAALRLVGVGGSGSGSAGDTAPRRGRTQKSAGRTDRAMMRFVKSNAGRAPQSPQQQPQQLHRIAALLIDPQNDFVEPTGSLSVPGALEDTQRVADAMRRHLDDVDGVFVTLDTHQRFHIAHALFWVNAGGERPKPFTEISLQDLKDKKWMAARPEFQSHAMRYVERLERGGRFKLVVWPDHCLYGTRGHAVHDALASVLHEWEGTNDHAVCYVLKGNNSVTEMYSALEAEVPIGDDPRTHLNLPLIESLLGFDRIVVAGQALSHCVNFTVRDLVDFTPPGDRAKIWIVADGSSPVVGCQAQAQTFLDDMRKAGCTITTAAEAFVLPSGAVSSADVRRSTRNLNVVVAVGGAEA